MSTPAPLPQRLLAHIRRRRLFAKAGTAIVAVSGGPDSVALLDLLQGLPDDLGLTLVVAHVDHGISTAGRAVGRTVAKLAEKYGLPFEITELNLGSDTTETEARRARYAWLRELQDRLGARYLVTAHHQDDQIETVLLRLLRGSASAGLAGMSDQSRGGLVRPLLPFARAELAEYVAARKLPVYDDPANRDPRHLRSWIRGTLLPLLNDRVGAQLRGDLLGLRAHAARDRHAWDRVLDILPDLALEIEDGAFTVARAALSGYDNALSVALLRAAARRAGFVLGPARARRLLRLAQGQSGRRTPLGRGWSAEVAFDRLKVSRIDREIGCAFERILPGGEQGRALFGAYEIAWSWGSAPKRLERAAWTTWLDGSDWVVRPPARGDSVRPIGGVGRRPLRRLLMEGRVPRTARSHYPVVARGATVLWVPGICRSADALPAPGTRAVRLDVTEHGAAQADRGS
jgi:tRNA(Ile)-lysidine synthase